MTLINFIDLLDALPASFSDFRIAVERDGNTYFAVNIALDVDERVIKIIDSSQATVDDIVYDANNRAELCDRKPEWPTDVERILELS